MSYQKILSDLKKKKFSSIYLFDGEEPYYIDALSDYIAENVLNEGEKDFNQSVVYARDTSPEELGSIVKRYPMMAEYQVVIVREAQNWSKQLDALSTVFANPVPTTILVVCYKGKKIDGRSKILKIIKENGVYFSSLKIKDYEVGKWINAYCKENNIAIDPRASAILGEHIGANLTSLIHAFDKLKILLPEGEKITPQSISQHIGISKDFNIFELQKALGLRQDYKALFIANYFANNQKDHHIVPIILGLYNYYSKLITYIGIRNETDKGSVAKAMGVHPYFIGEYAQAASNYSQPQIFASIDVLYDIELKAKGVSRTGGDSGQLVKELVSRLLRV